ncbi:hypothetical protein [Silvibacterium acidisoli]|uniref:hypothetical protein n=1 Tax=Acidobacteriaceae bacterium ZG23-2 TaxID=2883246 RepID=UPI00406CDF13
MEHQGVTRSKKIHLLSGQSGPNVQVRHARHEGMDFNLVATKETVLSPQRQNGF